MPKLAFRMRRLGSRPEDDLKADQSPGSENATTTMVATAEIYKGSTFSISLLLSSLLLLKLFHDGLVIIILRVFESFQQQWEIRRTGMGGFGLDYAQVRPGTNLTIDRPNWEFY